MIWNSVSHTYYSKSVLMRLLPANTESNVLINISFAMHPDVKVQKRFIYNFWELFGEIGGLFGALTLLGSKYFQFVGIFTGSTSSHFVNDQIFRLEPKSSKQPTNGSLFESLKSIKKRNAPRFSFSGVML